MAAVVVGRLAATAAAVDWAEGGELVVAEMAVVALVVAEMAMVDSAEAGKATAAGERAVKAVGSMVQRNQGTRRDARRTGSYDPQRPGYRHAQSNECRWTRHR